MWPWITAHTTQCVHKTTELQPTNCSFLFSIKTPELTFACQLSDFSEETKDLIPWPIKQSSFYFHVLPLPKSKINRQARIIKLKGFGPLWLHTTDLYWQMPFCSIFPRKSERAKWLYESQFGLWSIWRLIRLVTATPSPSSLSTLPPGN